MTVALLVMLLATAGLPGSDPPRAQTPAPVPAAETLQAPGGDLFGGFS